MGNKNSEWGMSGVKEQREDSLTPSKEPAAASLSFAEEEVAGPAGSSWTNLASHFLCSPHHDSAVGILEMWPFLGCLLQTCSERLGLRSSKQVPGLDLVSRVRHCTLVPFRGDLWPYPNFSETVDKSPRLLCTAQPQPLTCSDVGGRERCRF